MIIAVTGHRPNKLGGYHPNNPVKVAVKKWLKDELSPRMPDIKLAISGMAIGADQWFAEVCIELGIPFEAAVPFASQAFRWPPETKNIYYSLVAKAAIETIVSPGEYSPEKMQIRNKYMVDKCDLLLAVWNGTNGGTFNCINYARSLNKHIVYIPKSIISLTT